MIQLVIPMAGLGSRFLAEGYKTPKPLISIHGVEMYKIVLSNLLDALVSRVVIICPKSFDMKKLEPSLEIATSSEVGIIDIDYLTTGPATTAYISKELLDPDLPLVIANSDQFVDFQVSNFYQHLVNGKHLGAVLTMKDDNPKWSYAEVDSNNLITRIVEKEVISENATVGIYGFSHARDFFEAYERMIAANFRVNGEFYVAPSFQFSPSFNSRGVLAIDLGPVGEVMHGLGIPADLEEFLRTDVSRVAAINARAIFS